MVVDIECLTVSKRSLQFGVDTLSAEMLRSFCFTVDTVSVARNAINVCTKLAM